MWVLMILLLQLGDGQVYHHRSGNLTGLATSEDIKGGSSDEQCSDEQFQCADKCIPKRWQCDYHKDCENGEDEYDCPAPECDAGQWSCVTYKFNHTNCISSHFR